MLKQIDKNKIKESSKYFDEVRNVKDIENKMNELLSDLELEVLELYLNGKSYQYIADKLHRDVKSIDNALQRVKRKLEKHLENRND